MSVGPEFVDYVAKLAKLQLADDEKAVLASDLAGVLEFFEQLDRVDITDVPPTKHVIGLSNVERPDAKSSSLSTDKALANTADTDEDHFVVPKVLPD
ncbi:MAG TPA: Asp-tRNA(Asn)/Glu-tRNA(Gln) amidotransferase subunit GatC [Acidobacteriota bacterium]|jgi:aspartyl-tRNA(Asn)/glutamyl-tRNA(Gln) amidotransferase subunit C|nr:Asp-tRNA(Asn)/Glu-tRNA(Gln) amidotransferase subunit GatC [Acidobacteriota bacterium]MEE3273952.1 Asp-tRNA(Asn)/Glu-tRNA(Gln) amidotransferase subunit GatC [Acidobacteriota bacterium]HJO29936.1 Asp-tRNA(Asn)/Glu-tRNA(Gln) amidotransferase subunit GatC [Acidobacteriota bacterium]|tara:strand:- start:647 stop:937 length:291 start_codon:yes stop_codon:yes gene_type:complete